jgi:hypothetical protein
MFMLKLEFSELFSYCDLWSAFVFLVLSEYCYLCVHTEIDIMLTVNNAFWGLLLVWKVIFILLVKNQW